MVPGDELWLGTTSYLRIDGASFTDCLRTLRYDPVDSVQGDFQYRWVD